MTRKLHEIASEIQQEISSGRWSIQSAYAAKPYLDAMKQLGGMDDRYGLDSAQSIVLYFLSNAASWRGETARRVKAELNAMVKGTGYVF